MAKRPGKPIAEATAEPPTKGGEAAEKIVKGNAEALTVSGTASRATAVQELTRAYQGTTATKNAKNLTAAIYALAAVKSPAEFIELPAAADQGRGSKPLSEIVGTLPN